MEYTVCIKKKLLIFYSLLLPILAYTSFNNLMNIINGTGSVIGLGGFAMFGFILLPVLLFFTYKNNICKVNSESIAIGKNKYNFTDYKAYVSTYELPFKDRPLPSMFKKDYEKLKIQNRKNNQIIEEHELDIFSKEIEKLKRFLK